MTSLGPIIQVPFALIYSSRRQEQQVEACVLAEDASPAFYRHWSSPPALPICIKARPWEAASCTLHSNPLAHGDTDTSTGSAHELRPSCSLRPPSCHAGPPVPLQGQSQVSSEHQLYSRMGISLDQALCLGPALSGPYSSSTQWRRHISKKHIVSLSPLIRVLAGSTLAASDAVHALKRSRTWYILALSRASRSSLIVHTSFAARSRPPSYCSRLYCELAFNTDTKRAQGSSSAYVQR